MSWHSESLYSCPWTQAKSLTTTEPRYDSNPFDQQFTKYFMTKWRRQTTRNQANTLKARIARQRSKFWACILVWNEAFKYIHSGYVIFEFIYCVDSIYLLRPKISNTFPLFTLGYLLHNFFWISWKHFTWPNTHPAVLLSDQIRKKETQTLRHICILYDNCWFFLSFSTKSEQTCGKNDEAIAFVTLHIHFSNGGIFVQFTSSPYGCVTDGMRWGESMARRKNLFCVAGRLRLDVVGQRTDK